MDDSGLFVDTNILLTAVTPSRPHHDRALALLAEPREAAAILYASGQVLREWLVVATRPAEVNGLGLSLADALHDVRAFRKRLVILEETEKVGLRLLHLLASYPAAGRQIHDANIVATALAHGVRRILTLNVADLERFASEIELVELT